MPEPEAHPRPSSLPGEAALPALVDGHVHLHPSFEIDRFLDAAAANFRTAASRLGIEPVGKVLLLADPAGHDTFAHLQRQTDTRWSLIPAPSEPSALLARAGVETLILFAGRQLVSAEGVELLALTWGGILPDGVPLRDLIGTAVREDFVPVLPWGFGKWHLRRGRLLREVLAEQDSSSIFLGDNGCRLASAPRHPLFIEAQQRGIRTLPGTDPLPIPSQVRRPASFGAVIRLPARENPITAMKSALRDPSTTLQPYGKGQALLPFITQQLGLQLRKRHWRSSR